MSSAAFFVASEIPFYAPYALCSQNKEPEILHPLGRAEKSRPQHTFGRCRYREEHLHERQDIERDATGKDNRPCPERQVFKTARYAGFEAALIFSLHYAKIIQWPFSSKTDRNRPLFRTSKPTGRLHRVPPRAYRAEGGRRGCGAKPAGAIILCEIAVIHAVFYNFAPEFAVRHKFRLKNAA